MTFPIVETPRYELTLPSSDVKVQYRPFLVKEEKILYIALESGDEQQMQQATKDILKSVTFDKLDVEELPTFDVEYIFLQVRAKSVGEIAKFKIICPDDKTTYGDVEVDISKVEVQVDDAHTNNIILNFAISPTDFALTCKKIYSTSNVGRVSTSILSNVTDFKISFVACCISFSSPDSSAIYKIFSSFTRKGLYCTFSSCDGNVNSYLGVSTIGNAIITPYLNI